MSLIRIKGLSKQYDDRQVLREAFLKIHEGDRVGLIGSNGSGKTTVLKIILGQEEPTRGSVDTDEGLRIGYFSQFSELKGDMTIDEVLNDLFLPLQQLADRLQKTEHAMSAGPDEETLQSLLATYEHDMAEMDRLDGWNYRNRIDMVLSKLSFSDVHRHLPIDQLSGGWRNRAALARILLENPDVLLLDEPTNYLDIAGLSWLEGWFEKFKGAVVLVSHDRDFLERVARRIVEIENYHFQEYEGGFIDYIRKKQVRTKQLVREYEFEEELIAFESEAIKDRLKAAKNPGHRLKKRLSAIKKGAAPKEVDRIVTGIYSGIRSPEILCTVEDLAKGYDDTILFLDVSLVIHRGDRLAIVGPNGCGKSTLIRVLCGEEEPDSGRISWHVGSPFSNYNNVSAELDEQDTVTHLVNVGGLGYAAPRKQVNRFLQLLQFSEAELNQRIGNLSGGQKARVALATSLLSGSPTIILDEPTNHLDLKSTQVMERALAYFPGAVVVVSHDRFFIDKIANRLMVFRADGEVETTSGNWTTWRAEADG